MEVSPFSVPLDVSQAASFLLQKPRKTKKKKKQKTQKADDWTGQISPRLVSDRRGAREGRWRGEGSLLGSLLAKSILLVIGLACYYCE